MHDVLINWFGTPRDRGVKIELHILAQDAKNGDHANGVKSLCRAVNLYGGVAAYVDSVRTDV
jgi:hypothetical protein